MSTPHPLWTFALTAACAAQGGSGRDAPPPEFGRIAWERDFAAATSRAEREQRPLLLLFQEVPG